uniref:Transposable element n=2 Tax=Oryza sativa subsp. japonica TaxID=39947 RepID=A0A5S6RDT6_ORYSJ|nr:Putative transposable element [Oryza sativa Japonica Group]AAP52866.1 transposon protein, putative, CACTA, En/Spm sub-class [Oryza sativa Japonica Group]
MEEDEVEDDNIPDFAQYTGFDGNQSGEEDRDADDNDVADDLGQMLQDAKEDCESEKGAHKLDKMLEDHRTSLYPGCDDKTFGDLLKLVKNILPEGNKLPETTYEAKKIVCPLGLEVQKIHACPNDCILYRGEEYENLEACHVCKALRYKIRRDDLGEVDRQLTKKRIPAKVMWYFPIIPRLRRSFRNKGNVRMMRWHAEERQQDGMLRHPADGPKQPGNDIDVFLGPLVENLKLLWKKEGVPMWDEDKQEEFNLRALLFVTINDWPALSNLSGQSNKGYKACTHCMDETESTYLKHCVYGKSKDTLEARNDLKHMEQRGNLHPEPKDKGSHYLSPASYTLSKAEKEIMFECLKSIKLCHLVKEIGILGAVYLHNMFPFERYMGVLKKYVRNRARPEASIAKGYVTEEVIEFCVEFIEDLRPIGVPESRHEGRLRGKGTLGRKAIMTVDNYLFRKAHFTVLQQSSLVAPYIKEHLALVRARNINMKSTNQNSAVRIDAMGHDGTTGTYYGAIEDIWELDYGPLKVPQFRCQWVRLTGEGVTIDDSGMTTVDLNNVGYSDEPFVLANDVTQVFYVKDMSSKGKKGKWPDEPKRHVVLPGKRKIVGIEDKTDEDYDQFDGQPPFTMTIDSSILLSNEDTPYSCSDHKEGTIMRRKFCH